MPKRRWKRWLWIIPLSLILLVVWLNGPGLRWIAPKVAVHYLEKAGLRGNFSVKGSLTGGLSLSDLKIEGDKELASLTVDDIIPDYEWRGLVKGELKGLTIKGVHADIRLGLEKEEQPEKPPLDLKKLVETIRMARERVVPLEIQLSDISLAATQDEKPFFALAPSGITHATGSSDLVLELGEITDPTGKVWPAQKSVIEWQPESLAIQQIDPLPGIGLRDFVLQLPTGGEPSAETRLLVDNAVFVVTTSSGFTSAKVDLREGQLQVDETAKRFVAEIPAKATLTSLVVEVDGVLPDPKAATGTVQLLLEDVAWEDWAFPEFGLDATLAEQGVNVAARGMFQGTGISLKAEAPVSRDNGAFALGDAKGSFNIADVPALLRELSTRFPAIDGEAPTPQSSVDGEFAIQLEGNQPKQATASVVLKPQDEVLVSPVALKGTWQPDAPVSVEATVDGLTASATYGLQTQEYAGNVSLESFTEKRIQRWLDILKVQAGVSAELTGRWSGSGSLVTGNHKGELAFSQATVTRDGASPVTAIGGMSYDWPTRFETKGLRVQMDDQSVALEAALGDGMLELRNLTWSEGAEALADGRGTLPVPDDFSKWRETLMKDARSLDLSIQTRVLSFGVLKKWVPALEALDPRSTGQLGIEVSGTYSEPVIAAKFEARDLRSPAQPGLPPADLKISLSGKDGRLALEGEAVAPDFAPAVFKAGMAFKPSEWAEKPDLIMEESIEARADLPRLDLSRFTSLVPAAQQMSGIVTGNVQVSGKLSKPVVRGSVDLTGGGFRIKDDPFPAITDITASVDMALDRVVLKSLRSSVAGGTLQADGSVQISEGKLGEIRFQARGNHLPIMRNDSLILRANANLQLAGTLERSTLSGTVGAVDSIFYRDIEILPIGRPFTGPSAASLPKIDKPQAPASSIPEPFRNWGLNVNVRTDEPVIIRGNLANGEVSGGIRVGGTLGSPAPDGAFTIRNLRASLPFSTLEVRRGTISFRPDSGFDPILEVRGTSDVRPYQITIYAYGTASNPQLVLTSNPPLPENEIMTLIATGTTTSGLEDPSVASSRALHLLAEEMRRGRVRFAKRLRPLLALADRVDFSVAEADPYSNEKFSTATIELTDRFFVSTGMGATGDSRVLAIWRLRFH